VAPAGITFRELDRQGIPTGVHRRFQELPSAPRFAFRITRGGDTGAVLDGYRLMDVATGRKHTLRHVGVKLSRSGDWVLTTEGWESVGSQLEAQLGLRLMRITPHDQR